MQNQCQNLDRMAQIFGLISPLLHEKVKFSQFSMIVNYIYACELSCKAFV